MGLQDNYKVRLTVGLANRKGGGAALRVGRSP